MNHGHGRPRVAVVVLGDLGRSPRMQYHALALAETCEVDLIGSAGTALSACVRQHPHIRCRQLAARGGERRRDGRGFVIAAGLRAGCQLLALGSALMARRRRPDLIIVQTPPAFPTLLVAAVAARMRRAKLVIDWHNFGYAMLALKLGARHPVVTLSRRGEGWIGRGAQAHLCVSSAMQAQLRAQWNIDATVLYDRPAAMFAPRAAGERAAALQRFADVVRLPTGNGAAAGCALIVSPTSWTLDEDFSLLIDAAVALDDRIQRYDASAGTAPFPHLLIVATGHGPLRAAYERRVASLALRKVHLRTAWLPPDDYPALLAAADLGLCLHRSASGADLPMKVVDLFGCGVPVCAFDYGPCVTEQIRHGENGLLFSSSAQLAEQLFELFAAFPARAAQLEALRRGVARPMLRWADGWKLEAEPVLSALLEDRR